MNINKEMVLWTLSRVYGKLIIGIDPGIVNFGIVVIRHIPLNILMQVEKILTADEILENLCKIIYADNVNIKEDYGVGTYGVSKFIDTLQFIDTYWLRYGGKIKMVHEYQMAINRNTRGANDYITGYICRLKKMYNTQITVDERKPNFKKGIVIGNLSMNSYYANCSNHRTVNKKFVSDLVRQWLYPIKTNRKKIDDIGDALLLAIT
jgi:Holliday junction resolvasome RuvABC endonuclease subunit